jgi:hypothetical protein
MRGPHDIGGLPAGPVAPTEHALAPWEKRVHALMNLLSCHKTINLHEMRREIETLGAHEYDQLSYYERWITAITRLLLEKGVLTTEELTRKLAEVEARDES